MDTYPAFLQHPTAIISNDSPVGGRSVYALHKGADDFAVLNSFPDRPIYQLRLLGEYGKHPHSGYGAILQRLRLVAGRSLRVDVQISPRESVTQAQLLVAVGNQQLSSQTISSGQSRVPITFSRSGSSVRQQARA